MAVTPALILDLGELFKTSFGSKPYVLGKDNGITKNEEPYKNITASTKEMVEFTKTGSELRTQLLGVEIFLPIKLFDEDGKTLLMDLPYCVIRISGKNNYVSTPMIDRKGSVKELYSSDDFKITVKGFLIGADRKFPEDEIKKLAAVMNKTTALVLDNAITNIFLSDPLLPDDEQRRVVVESFDMPEVQGGREHVRPFSIELESDTIFDLEIAP